MKHPHPWSGHMHVSTKVGRSGFYNVKHTCGSQGPIRDHVCAQCAEGGCAGQEERLSGQGGRMVTMRENKWRDSDGGQKKKKEMKRSLTALIMGLTCNISLADYYCCWLPHQPMTRGLLSTIRNQFSDSVTSQTRTFFVLKALLANACGTSWLNEETKGDVKSERQGSWGKDEELF